MKKYCFLVFITMLIIGCTEGDSNAQLSDVGQGGSLAIFTIKGDYLYSVDEMTLNVFSIIDNAKPVKVNSVRIGFDIETLFSYGENLYIGSRNGMFIYSVVNPENPAKLSSVSHFTACDPVIANSTHSYVTLHSNTNCGNSINVLQVYDTKNASNPKLIRSRNLTHPKGIGFYNTNYLVVCDDVIKIFDIQNPAQPTLVNSIDKKCFDVIIRGNTMFAIGNDGVYLYQMNSADIKDIKTISEVTFK